MLVSNVEVYGLSESIVASRYPMMVDKPTEDEFEDLVESVSMLINDNIFKKILEIKNENILEIENIGDNTPLSCLVCGSGIKVTKSKIDNNYYCSKHNKKIIRYGEVKQTFKNIPNEINVKKDCLSFYTKALNGDITGEFLFDIDDFEKVISSKWKCSNGYASCGNITLLHREILSAKNGDVVDHINRNTFDNRKHNLRLTNKQNNNRNSKTPSSNTSGIIGVSYRDDRGKWRAFLMVDKKQISLGLYENFEDAVKARLFAEKIYFKEYSPQRHLFKEYGLSDMVYDDDIIPQSNVDFITAFKALNRASSLGKTKVGSAHDQSLTGIIVQFDLDFTIKAWTEAERYHFLDFVSSMSTMHKLTEFKLDASAFDEHVDSRIIDIMNELQDKYNADKSVENYLNLIYSNPVGMKLTARMTTNYRQLKTIYNQRHNHKLPEWREFCNWILTLPYFSEITGIEKETNQ